MKRWKRIFRNVAVVFLSTGTILSVPVTACAHVEETAEEAQAEQEGNLGNTTLQSEKEETVPEQKAGSEEEQTGENQKKDVNAFSTAGNGQVQDREHVAEFIRKRWRRCGSKEDILLTDRLQQVGDLLRIPLMDHIITGKNYEYYSIREQMDYRASPAELTDDANSLKWTQTMVAEEQFYQDSSNAEETKQKKLDEIMEGLERGVNDILSSENYKKYLKFLSTYDDLQEGLDVYFSMRSTTKTFEMVIDGMSGDNVTLLSNINGEDRVNSELIEMDSVGRKLESTLEIIQKEVDRHNAIVEKDVKLSFYAAECDDFPILGEYHENIETFEEAIKIYENLKKDRFLGDEGIGFKLTVNGKYKGRFTLIQGANRLIGLEKEGSFMDHPMINQAVDKAKRYVKSFEKSEMIQATAKRNTTKIEL